VSLGGRGGEWGLRGGWGVKGGGGGGGVGVVDYGVVGWVGGRRVVYAAYVEYH